MSSPPSQRTGAYTTPTLLSLKALEEREAGADASPAPSWFPAPAGLLRTAVLAAGAATSAAVASGGFLVLLYLVATHSMTPRQLLYTTPLQLDLSGNDLVSRAWMAAPAGSTPPPDAKSAAGARFLPPGQHVDVWLDLEVPVGGISAASCARGGDLAYVSAALLGREGGAAVAKATHPVVLRTRAAPLWAFLSAPLRWAGLLADARTVSVQLFSDYAERQDAPFDAFSVSVRPRPGDPAPAVVGAALRVHLRVGWLRRALYHLRPHSLLALALGAGAACALAGGAGGVALCLGLLAYVLLRGGGGGGGGGAQSAGALSPASRSDSEATELLAGVSSTATTPRELSEEDEAAAAAGGGVSPPERQAAPREDRPWQQLLKQLPAGGRPLHGDDTPYVGSDAAAGGASGRAELGSTGLRMRGASSASRDLS